MDRRYALNSVRLQTAVLAISVKTLFNNWTKHWTKPLLIIYTSTAPLRRGRLTAAVEVSAQLQNFHAIEYAPAQTLPSQPTCDNKRHFIQCLKANWEKGGPRRIRIEKKKKICVDDDEEDVPDGTVPRGHPLFWANFGVALRYQKCICCLTQASRCRKTAAPPNSTQLLECAWLQGWPFVFTVVAKDKTWFTSNNLYKAYIIMQTSG